MKTIKSKRGKSITLLNPAEKARKFADELNNKVHQTNDGHLKFDKFGQPASLTDTERSYRSGYLAARKDSAKLYNWKQKKGYN